MASTTLLNFHVPSQVLCNAADRKAVQKQIDDIFREAGFNSQPHTVVFESGQSGLTLYTGTDGRTAVVQSYPGELITVNIQQNVREGEEAQLTEQQLKTLHSKLAKLLGCEKSKRFPNIKRGVGPCDRYIPTVDNRLVEYDFDRVVFEKDTEFQNVKILHSPQYGNVLILDDDPNLAESDIAYTEAITGNGRENYSGKDVLVLGAGDGGILHFLRQQDTASIIMIEIDKVVIDAAVKYLRGICFDSMDDLQGPNYQVIVDDCVPVLKRYAAEGRHFDYVINDLTAIPITTEPQGELWDFMRLILDLCMRVLKPSGKYFTQGNGANMTDALAMYEEQLKKLSFQVDFSKEMVCVPSYLEMWVFYEIWKKLDT